MSTAAPEPPLPASLCFVRPPVADAEEALRLLAVAAVDQGYALRSFPDAVIDRERAYPTGLPVATPVAIPHTDARHVVRPAFAALVPPLPLRFGEMGSRDKTVDVGLVLMLLVADPAEQVPLLGRLIPVLRRPDLDQVLLQGVDQAEALAERFARLMTE